MKSEKQQERILEQRITRRAAIKAGGIAAVGLAFSKPIIETIHPKPIFANTGTGVACNGSVTGHNLYTEVSASTEYEANMLASEVFRAELRLVCAGNCPTGDICFLSQEGWIEYIDLGDNMWACSAVTLTVKCECITPV